MPTDRRKLRSDLQRTRTKIELEAACTKAVEDARKSASASANVPKTPRAPPRRRPAAKPIKVGGKTVLQGELICDNGFGKVYYAEHPTTKQKLIVKKVILKDRDARKKAEAEIQLLEHLFQHPHIIQFQAGHVSKKVELESGEIRPAQALYCFEYCEAGTLLARLEHESTRNGSDFAIDSCPCASEQLLSELLSGASAALSYLAKLEIVHYNINCKHLFFGVDGCWKLGDFGVASQSTFDLSKASKTVMEEAREFMLTRCTVYRPLEAQDVSLRWPIGPKVDMFCLGCVLLLSMMGPGYFSEGVGNIPPWPPLEAQAAYSVAMIRWVRRLVAREPDLRPSAVELAGEVSRFLTLHEDPPELSENALASALAELQEAIASLRFDLAAALVVHTKRLTDLFASQQATPKVEDLLEQAREIADGFQEKLLRDYATLIGPERSQSSTMDAAAACIDALGAFARRTLITNSCDKLLEPYREIFGPPRKDSGLDSWGRRYPWLKRTLRDFDSRYSRFFPAHWNIPFELSALFCHTTRRDLVEVLGALTSVDGDVLMQVMQESFEFEQFLESKISENTDGATESGKADESRAPRFAGVISGAFDAYLDPWVKKQERSVIEAITEAMKADKVVVVGQSACACEGDKEVSLAPRLVYSSTVELMKGVRAPITKCDSSMKQTLFGLFGASRRCLKHYVAQLESKLPSRLTLRRPLDDEGLQTVCGIVGTCAYCEDEVLQLQDHVASVVDSMHRSSVSYSDELNSLRATSKSAHHVLVQSVLLGLDEAFAKFKRTNWASHSDCSGKSSPYVDDVADKVNAQFQPICKYLSKADFGYFCDRFARFFIERLIEEVLKCRKVNAQGVQQLLLDFSYVRGTLLEAPVVCTGSTLKTVYDKYVIREMGKADTMLKVIAGGEDAEAALTQLYGEEPSIEAEAEIDRLLSLRTDGSEPKGGCGAASEVRLSWRDKLAALGEILQDHQAKTTEGWKELQDNMNKWQGNVVNALQAINIPPIANLPGITGRGPL